MADDHEQAIATYLTLDGQVFIAPQFNVAFDRELNEGGSCPDFVALDLSRSEVVIVEITSAANMKPLFERVNARQTRWFGPVRRHLTSLGMLGEGWKRTRFLGFIRFQNYELATGWAIGMDDVAYYPIEAATFPWSYWDARMRDGLPDKLTALPPTFGSACQKRA